MHTDASLNELEILGLKVQLARFEASFRQRLLVGTRIQECEIMQT